MADIGPIEKPPVKLRDNPREFLGPEAWAFRGARDVWKRIYLAVQSGRDVREALFEAWPELIAFDIVSNSWIENDRAQGGTAWAKRVAWWDNTAAQRQQIVEACSDDYTKLENALKERTNA